MPAAVFCDSKGHRLESAEGRDPRGQNSGGFRVQSFQLSPPRGPWTTLTSPGGDTWPCRWSVANQGLGAQRLYWGSSIDWVDTPCS